VRVHCVWRTGSGTGSGALGPWGPGAMRVADGLAGRAGGRAGGWPWAGRVADGLAGWRRAGGRAGDGLADQGWKLVDLAAQAAEPNE
jgi:hypothetical protein